jgi:hypothetical protein
MSIENLQREALAVAERTSAMVREDGERKLLPIFMRLGVAKEHAKHALHGFLTSETHGALAYDADEDAVRDFLEATPDGRLFVKRPEPTPTHDAVAGALGVDPSELSRVPPTGAVEGVFADVARRFIQGM